MQQQKLGLRYCSIQNHNKFEVEKFCKQENCQFIRLVCHKCLNEEHHSGHLPNLERIQQLPKYFEDYHKNCDQYRNEVEGQVNSVQDNLKKFFLLFQEIFYFEQLNECTSKEISWALNTTFQFDQVIKKDIAEKIQYGFNQLKEILSSVNEELEGKKIEMSQKYYNEGYQLYQKDKYENALKYIDGAIKLNPKYHLALWCKGQCLRMLDKETEALSWLDKALEIDPNHVDSLFSKGECLRILEKESEALMYQEKAIKIQPTHIGALYSAGECLRELGKKQEALDYLEKALQINPNHIRSLGSKAACLADLKRYKQAIVFYDKALLLDPNYKFSENGKKFCLQQLGEK